MQETHTIYLKDEFTMDGGDTMVVKADVENGAVDNLLAAQGPRGIFFRSVEEMEKLAVSLVNVAQRARALVEEAKKSNSANVKKPRS